MAVPTDDSAAKMPDSTTKQAKGKGAKKQDKDSSKDSKETASGAADAVDASVPVAPEPSSEITAADAVDAETGDAPESTEISAITLKVKPPDADVYEVIVNPRATIIALKELFTEDLNSKLCTNFSLVFNGEELSDATELAQIEGMADGATLIMREEPYSEHAMHFHLIRVREALDGIRTPFTSHILSPALALSSYVARGEGYLAPDSPSGRNSPKRGSPGRRSSPTGEASASQGKHAFATFDPENPFSLASFIPANLGKPVVECIEYVKLSPWNPPTRQRKLAGDFAYLLAKSFEGKEYHITACAAGFYINKSTDSSFDPRKAPSAPFHHTLPGLLSRLSPIFKANFARQLNDLASRPVLEYQPAFPEAAPWALPAQQPTEDTGRQLDTYIQGIEQLEQPIMRDYHEEIQAAREMPKETTTDRINRDAQIHRVMTDFADAATRAVVNIIDGNIPPLDSSQPEERRVTVYNNMIFSQGPDKQESFEKIGGAEAWHVIMSKEVQGTRLINDLDLEGVHTMGTVVVEYKGRRFVVQTLIPGFLTRITTPPVIHGYVDETQQIVTDEQMVPLFDSVGQKLHLARHVIKDAEGNEHTFRTSVETKGMRGCDARNYILDLYRLQPVDILFLEGVEKDGVGVGYPHKLCLVRQEVVEQYYMNKLRQHVAEKRNERIEALKKEKGTDGPAKANGKHDHSHDHANGEHSHDHDHDEQEEFEITPEEEEEWINSLEVEFNPDAFNPSHETGANEEERVKDEGKVRELATFLHNVVIPSFIQEISNHGLSFSSAVMDEEHFREMMHSRGINMRFLGTILRALKALPETNESNKYLIELIQHEMVIRGFKRVMGRVVGGTSPLLSVQAITHMLNCLFGPADVHPQAPYGPEVPLPASVKSSAAFAKYSVSGLWSEIRAEVKTRFRHVLPSDFAVTRRLPVLRSLCQRLGLQVLAREYDWDAPNAQIFTVDDILNMYPITKSPEVRSSVGEDMLETARMALNQGQIKLCFELLQESIMAFEQTFGVVHPDTSKPLSLLAAIQTQTNDKTEQESSVLNQHKVVTIVERTRGLDNWETIQAYIQLGSRLVDTGDHVPGLNYLRHACELVEMLTCSKPHSELYQIYTKIGNSLLNHLSDFPLALTYLERALRVGEACYGADHPLMPYAHHNVAIGFLLSNESKKALTSQRTAYQLLLARYGEKDERVQEASEYLELFTKRAVETAKNLQRAKITPAKPAVAEATSKPASVEVPAKAAPAPAAKPAAAPLPKSKTAKAARTAKAT